MKFFIFLIPLLFPVLYVLTSFSFFCCQSASLFYCQFHCLSNAELCVKFEDFK